MKSVWDEIWGDRRQELVIIGQDLNQLEVTDALNACLLSDQEMQSGPASWSTLPDPFGPWEMGCDDSECDDPNHHHH